MSHNHEGAAPQSSQIIWLEKRVAELEEELYLLRKVAEAADVAERYLPEAFLLTSILRLELKEWKESK